jgi:hypothetical protein
MQTKDVMTILESLIHGRDPDSGEELLPDNVMQRATVLRALLVAKTAIEATMARESRRSSLPKCVGKEWSQAEEAKLTVAFHDGRSISDLAKDHMRTERAIEARLIRLGILEIGDSQKKPFFTA